MPIFTNGMDIFQKNKKALLFIGIFIVVVLGYFFFSGGGASSQNVSLSPSENSLISVTSASPYDTSVGRELLSILTELQSIALDTSIFTNPVFTNLKDWSRPIDPQPFGKELGRRNPFSDFASGVNVTQSTRSTSNVPSSAFGNNTTR